MIIMSLPHVNGYDIIEKIGVGSFSAVYKAKGQDNNFVAVKCIDKRYQKKSFADNVVKEISFLKLLKHEYIVTLIDFLWDAKHIFIVMEYCNEGDLSQYIRKKHKLFEALVKIFMQQLSTALQFLHQNKICHMDLKPQNLLLQSQPKLKLKLADFGLSQYISGDNEHCRFAGSLLYMAPEKLLNLQFDSRVDLWSVGIIMYECLFGRPPYIRHNTKTIVELMQRRTPIELPPNACISAKCHDLLTRLLKHDPNERIQFEEFFRHPFLELDYLPTKENFAKVSKIIEEAILLDKKKQYVESLAKYQEGIRYVQAFLAIETNVNKKIMLNHKLNEYIHWSNRLSSYLKNSSNSLNDVYQPLPLSEEHFETLCELAAVTPSLATGLEIGSTGELYLSEGKYKLALEKLTVALEMLLPILSKEPPGPRKELLHTQIKKWLSMAEALKKNT